MESERKLHFINSLGVQVDIPLYDNKAEALSNDEADGQAFAVFDGEKPLYAPTNDKIDVPDQAVLHFVDKDRKLRHVHSRIGELTLVRYATLTTSFYDIEIDFPYGGKIVARASNGSPQYRSSSTRAYGGSSGFGWRIKVSNGLARAVLFAPSGAGAGGNGETKVYPYDVDRYWAPVGNGSELCLNFFKGTLSISGECGQNGGGDFVYHANPYGNDGGRGGNSWPNSSSQAAPHRGGNGVAGSNRGYQGAYGYVTTDWGGKGGAGGYGCENVVGEVNGSPLPAGFAEFALGEIEFAATLNDSSQSAHSVEIWRWEYV